MPDDIPSDAMGSAASPQDALVHQPKGAIASTTELNEHVEQLAHEVLALKLAALNETNTAEAAIKQLRGRLWWQRIGLLLLFGLLGGLTLWQTLNLRQQRLQLAQMEAALSALDTSQIEQVQQLSVQLSEALEQVPEGLPTALEQTQENVSTLQTDLEALQNTIGDRQRALVVLTQALQALVNDEGNPVEPTVSQPSPPQPPASPAPQANSESPSSKTSPTTETPETPEPVQNSETQ